MAERYGHRIRRIVRGRFEREYALYHVDDLTLFRPAIADNSLLNLEGRILVHRQSRVIAGEQYDSPALRDGDAGSYIGVEKELLYCRYVGLEGAYDLAHVRVDAVEPA